MVKNATTVRFSVIGAKRFNKSMKKLGADAPKAIKVASKLAAEVFKQQMKRTIPSRTGALRRSLSITTRNRSIRAKGSKKAVYGAAVGLTIKKFKAARVAVTKKDIKFKMKIERQFQDVLKKHGQLLSREAFESSKELQKQEARFKRGEDTNWKPAAQQKKFYGPFVELGHEIRIGNKMTGRRTRGKWYLRKAYKQKRRLALKVFNKSIRKQILKLSSKEAKGYKKLARDKAS